MKNLRERLEWAMQRMKPRPPTVIEMAKGCGVERAAVYLWLNGTTSTLKPETYWDAAKFLGVDRDWLETGIGDPITGAEKQVIVDEKATDAEKARLWDAYTELDPSDQLRWLAMRDVLKQTSETQLAGRLGVVDFGKKKNGKRNEPEGSTNN